MGAAADFATLDAAELGKEASQAEARLWSAVLEPLIQDARVCWLGTDYCRAGSKADRWVAFSGMVECSPTLRQICDFTGHDPEWLPEGFVRWCERSAPLGP